MSAPLDRLRSLTKPVLDGFVARTEQWTDDLTSRLEETRSKEFPLSFFCYLTRPGVEDPVIVEVSVSDGGKEFLSAEVMTEEGRILSPTLQRSLPKDPRRPEWEQAAEQFAEQLEPFLTSSLPSVLTALGASVLVDELRRLPADLGNLGTRGVERALSLPGTASRELKERFVRDVQSRMSKILGVDLAPARLSLGEGSLDFELVSQDRSIAGRIQRDTAGRIPTAVLTDRIWQLKHVSSARRRLLVVGPEKRSVERWLRLYGAEDLGGVELWWMDSAEPVRLA